MSKPTTMTPRPAALVALEGTPKQVAYGESVRRGMLAVLRRSAPPDVLARLNRVKDATWWIANKGRPLDAIRWPSPHQLDGAHPAEGATGATPPATAHMIAKKAEHET